MQIHMAKRGAYAMLLQALGNPILFDGVPAVKDFQLNLPYPQRQLRAKMVFLDQTGLGPPETPADIYVSEYDFGLEKLNLVISINGTEMTKNIRFAVKLGYDFIRRRWRLTGSWNDRAIEYSLNAITDIFGIIQKLATNHSY